MKIITLSAILLLFLTITFNLYAQDDIKNYRQPDVSKGTSVILGGNLMYNDYHDPIDPNITYDYRNADVNTGLNASHWRFTPKTSYGIFVSASGLYHYEKSSLKNNETTFIENIREYSRVLGILYGAGEHYINKVFFSAAYQGTLSYYSSYNYSKQQGINT